MKSTIFKLGLAASIMLAACGENKTEETIATDSSSTSMSTPAPAATTPEATTSVNTSFNENGSYVDLKTNKPVKFKKDPESHNLVNYETNEPYDYYFYSPATRDTFDRYGYVVNNYLLKDASGMYTIDEKRWKVKQDSDGDIKMKDGEGTKIKYDASSGKVKMKDEDTTIKVKP